MNAFSCHIGGLEKWEGRGEAIDSWLAYMHGARSGSPQLQQGIVQYKIIYIYGGDHSTICISLHS